MDARYQRLGRAGVAIVTDLVQGLRTIVLSFPVLPIALRAVGGLIGLRHGFQFKQFLY